MSALGDNAGRNAGAVAAGIGAVIAFMTQRGNSRVGREIEEFHDEQGEVEGELGKMEALRLELRGTLEVGPDNRFARPWVPINARDEGSRRDGCTGPAPDSRRARARRRTCSARRGGRRGTRRRRRRRWWGWGGRIRRPWRLSHGPSATGTGAGPGAGVGLGAGAGAGAASGAGAW